MDTRFSDMSFREVLIGSLQNLTGRSFRESQKRVPVKTGYLKSSGSVSYGATTSSSSKKGDVVGSINYSAPYAAAVNRTNTATSGKKWMGTRKKQMAVKRHKRTYPSGKTVTVRSHKKNVGPRAAGRGNGFLTLSMRSELRTFVDTEFPSKKIQVKELGL